MVVVRIELCIVVRRQEKGTLNLLPKTVSGDRIRA